MPEVELEKMSGGTMSRLRNGHSCRCALAKTKGSGVKADLDESDIKELIKAGKKGAKKTIKLSREAIDRNSVKGTGIMQGGRVKIGKTLKKIGKSKAVQGLKKQALKEVGDAAVAGLESEGVPAGASKKIVKILEKKADEATGGSLKKALKKAHVGRKLKNVAKRSDVQAVKKEGLKMLGDAAVAGLEMEGVPPPLAQAGVKALEKKADKMTGGRVRKGRKSRAEIEKDRKGEAIYVEGVRGGGVVEGVRGGGIREGSGLQMRGGAIGPAVAPETLVRFGSGGNLLQGRNPALMSQAESENFHMHTQLPPFLARRMVD